MAHAVHMTVRDYCVAIYFQRSIDQPGKLAGGLLSAMFGLVLFVDGLVWLYSIGELLASVFEHVYWHLILLTHLFIYLSISWSLYKYSE